MSTTLKTDKQVDWYGYGYIPNKAWWNKYGFDMICLGHTKMLVIGIVDLWRKINPQ